MFSQWEKDEIIKQVYVDNPRKNGFYWAHFPVIKKDRQTTKIRPVFDGKAKNFEGRSINSYIMAGPVLLNDLTQVLMHFRSHQNAILADISLMFLQILLKEEDQEYHRFLWYRNNKLVIFQCLRHIFGNAGSPAVAIFAIMKLAWIYRFELPEAYKTVLAATVMDDFVDSRPTITQAIELVKELQLLFPKCQMKIAKFFSNRLDVLNTVPPALRQVPKDESCIKVLGLKWNPKRDSMSIKIPNIPSQEWNCLLYTSPSPRDLSTSRMPSSA